MASRRAQKILILCRANSCRSQMAAAFLERLDSALLIRSAGTNPVTEVHPLTIKVMKEAGIDISDREPVDIRKYIDEPWDFLITVCDVAKNECPTFHGKVERKIYYRFVDPLEFAVNQQRRSDIFRNVRDDIEFEMEEFYEMFISKKNSD